MTSQPSIPSPPPQLPPPHASMAPPSDSGARVRCAGCRMILIVAPELTEFACPTCRMPQMLPPEPMARVHQTAPPTTSPTQNFPAPTIDPTKMQIPCPSCMAILNVPYGLSRFSCPQCKVDLAVDLSKVKQFLPPHP